MNILSVMNFETNRQPEAIKRNGNCFSQFESVLENVLLSARGVKDQEVNERHGLKQIALTINKMVDSEEKKELVNKLKEQSKDKDALDSLTPEMIFNMIKDVEFIRVEENSPKSSRDVGCVESLSEIEEVVKVGSIPSENVLAIHDDSGKIEARALEANILDVNNYEEFLDLAASDFSELETIKSKSEVEVEKVNIKGLELNISEKDYLQVTDFSFSETEHQELNRVSENFYRNSENEYLMNENTFIHVSEVKNEEHENINVEYAKEVAVDDIGVEKNEKMTIEVSNELETKATEAFQEKLVANKKSQSIPSEAKQNAENTQLLNEKLVKIAGKPSNMNLKQEFLLENIVEDIAGKEEELTNFNLKLDEMNGKEDHLPLDNKTELDSLEAAKSRSEDEDSSERVVNSSDSGSESIGRVENDYGYKEIVTDENLEAVADDVVKQVSEKIFYQKDLLSETVKIELTPKSLGKVEVEVLRKEGKLHASIIVETEEARLMLKERSNELLTAFSNKRVELMDLKITVKREDINNNNFNLSSEDRNSGNQSYHNSYENKYTNESIKTQGFEEGKLNIISKKSNQNYTMLGNKINIFV